MPTITLYFQKCSRCRHQISLENVEKSRVPAVLRGYGWERIFGNWYCSQCSDLIFGRIRIALIILVCILLAAFLGSRFLG